VENTHFNETVNLVYVFVEIELHDLQLGDGVVETIVADVDQACGNFVDVIAKLPRLVFKVLLTNEDALVESVHDLGCLFLRETARPDIILECDVHLASFILSAKRRMNCGASSPGFTQAAKVLSAHRRLG